jgi:hypothetical protein
MAGHQVLKADGRVLAAHSDAPASLTSECTSSSAEGRRRPSIRVSCCARPTCRLGGNIAHVFGRVAVQTHR